MNYENEKKHRYEFSIRGRVDFEYDGEYGDERRTDKLLSQKPFAS